MPQTLSTPRVVGTPFQPGNPFAKAGAAASVAVRKAKRAAAAQNTTVSALAIKDTVSTAILQQLRLVAEQISHTRSVLNDERDYCPACERSGIEPHHRAQLLKALDTLLDRQRKLLGIPDPGMLRPQAGRTPRQSPGAWLELPSASCGVQPTTGSGQPPVGVMTDTTRLEVSQRQSVTPQPTEHNQHCAHSSPPSVPERLPGDVTP